MELFFVFLLLLSLPYAAFFLLPVRRFPSYEVQNRLLEPPSLFVYSFAFHIHTQFSYDSLGKPEDVYRALEEEGIDFAIITDHEVDYFKHFANDKVFVGIEKKINDEKGNLLGDLIDLGSVKVISHHFRKYRWKLERKKEYLFELINLKDSLVENRKALFLYLLLFPFVYPFSERSYLSGFLKVLDVEKYVKAFLREGWRNKVVGGLDHHVKVYIREVGIRFLFPSYRFSFSLMRNFLFTDRKVERAGDLVNLLSSFPTLISFSEKPTLYWREGNSLKVYAPYERVVVRVITKSGEKDYLGPNLAIELPEEECILCGYTYSFKVGSLFFGVRPLFVSDLIERR